MPFQLQISMQIYPFDIVAKQCRGFICLELTIKAEGSAAYCVDIVYMWLEIPHAWEISFTISRWTFNRRTQIEGLFPLILS